MKPIKITPENDSKIADALKSVNGDATAHTFHRAADIRAIAEQAEGTLLHKVPKKAAVGARWTETSGGDVAKSYRYSRQATRVELERRGAGWYLVNIHSFTLWQKGGGSNLHLTAAQDAIAVARFRENYRVIPEVETVNP